ncbi:MAG: DUF4440 domain-containing protein [Gemmatimonadaceae bacterium]
MRHWVGSLVLPLLVACGGEPDAALTGRQTATVRAEVERTLRDAYDLSRPGLPERMLALYPETGSVVSATSGAVLTSRDTLEDGIRYFWDNVGSNMRDPRWVWDRFFIDVLSPAAAAVTATYHIPHLNPRGEPHVLGGAMTVVMVKRGGRWIVVQEHLSDLPQTEPSTSH